MIITIHRCSFRLPRRHIAAQQQSYPPQQGRSFHLHCYPSADRSWAIVGSREGLPSVHVSFNMSLYVGRKLMTHENCRKVDNCYRHVLADRERERQKETYLISNMHIVWCKGSILLFHCLR